MWHSLIIRITHGVFNTTCSSSTYLPNVRVHAINARSTIELNWWYYQRYQLDGLLRFSAAGSPATPDVPLHLQLRWVRLELIYLTAGWRSRLNLSDQRSTITEGTEMLAGRSCGTDWAMSVVMEWHGSTDTNLLCVWRIGNIRNTMRNRSHVEVDPVIFSWGSSVYKYPIISTRSRPQQLENVTLIKQPSRLLLSWLHVVSITLEQ